MANLTRVAKSGSEWNSNFELITYNITVQEQEELSFFGAPLPDYSGPVDFIEHENWRQDFDFDPTSLALLKRLDFSMKIIEDEESTVDAFVAELLRALGYETFETLVCFHTRLRLLTCGEFFLMETDVCLLDNNTSEILLLAQEDKSHIKPNSDPEAHLIAEAIAAFQQNNKIRVDDLFLAPLEQQVIHGITMIGTFPRFYKIKVTSDLDFAVRFGQYPPIQTIVYRYTPRVPKRSDCMKPLDNRRLVMRCYEAFKSLVLPETDTQR